MLHEVIFQLFLHTAVMYTHNVNYLCHHMMALQIFLCFSKETVPKANQNTSRFCSKLEESESNISISTWCSSTCTLTPATYHRRKKKKNRDACFEKRSLNLLSSMYYVFGLDLKTPNLAILFHPPTQHDSSLSFLLFLLSSSIHQTTREREREQ